MIARKETPDILSDVLGGKPLRVPATMVTKTSITEHHNAGKHSSGKTEHHNVGDTEHLNAGKPAHQKASAEAFEPTADEDSDKVKVTFYIASDAVQSLEDAWLSLRKLTKQRTRRSTSKSKIVEAAIRMAAQDVADKGEQSRFVDALVKQ